MAHKHCVLDEDKLCTQCGECDRCDLDPDKICDNCGKCIADNRDYEIIEIDRIIME